MNALELIEKNREKLIKAMQEADATAYKYPMCEYRVYVDTDGDASWEEHVAGDNAYTVFKGNYDRVYVKTYCHQFFDVLWDYWFCGIGEFDQAFHDQFGFEPVDGEDLAKDTWMPEYADHGVSRTAFEDWLDGQRDEAIELIQTEEDYGSALDEVIEEIRRDYEL